MAIVNDDQGLYGLYVLFRYSPLSSPSVIIIETEITIYERELYINYSHLTRSFDAKTLMFRGTLEQCRAFRKEMEYLGYLMMNTKEIDTLQEIWGILNPPSQDMLQ